jgi:hypothetical protein
MSQSPLPTLNRRTVFAGAGTVGALAAAAAVLPRAEAPAAVATNGRPSRRPSRLPTHRAREAVLRHGAHLSSAAATLLSLISSTHPFV